MADNPIQRPFRASDELGRHASPGAASNINDPLAELARLIGQNDPFGEFGRDVGRHERAPAPVPGYPPAADEDLYRTHSETSVPGYVTAPQSYDEPYEQDAYDPNYDPNRAPFSPEDVDYYDEPPRRRVGVMALAAVFGLAVIGTAGAFGYRALVGSAPSGPPPVIKADSSPRKIVPEKAKEAHAKLINDRLGGAADEKLVSREEQPIDIPDKPTGVLPQTPNVAPAASVRPPVTGTGIIAGTEPKPVHTIVIRPDRPMVASAVPAAVPDMSTVPEAASPPAAEPAVARASAEPEAPPPPTHRTAVAAPVPQRAVAPAAAARNAPLSLSPNAAMAAPAPAAPARTAARSAAPAAAAEGGYAVQISSRRNEADAEAAFRTLQSKFPGQLNGRQPMIRRVDLGEKGIYYRAMIGPFGSADEASQLCSDLKAAGGSCFVQKI